MAFDERELESIREIVGDLCARRSPEALSDQIRTTYAIEGHSIIVSEEHREPESSAVWQQMPLAKLRLYRSRGEWMLYWMDADSRWYWYDSAGAPRKLATVVRHLDRDIYGCFFG